MYSPMHDFSVAVKRAVPRGSAFRAFPINFNHVSPSRAWCTLLASPPAREIIEVGFFPPGFSTTPLRRISPPSNPLDLSHTNYTPRNTNLSRLSVTLIRP